MVRHSPPLYPPSLPKPSVPHSTHLHRLLQDVVRADVRLGDHEEHGHLGQVPGNTRSRLCSSWSSPHSDRSTRGGCSSCSPSPHRDAWLRTQVHNHPLPQLPYPSGPRSYLERQGDPHVLLAHAHHAHVGPHNQARVVRHVACGSTWRKVRFKKPGASVLPCHDLCCVRPLPQSPHHLWLQSLARKSHPRIPSNPPVRP